MQEKPLRLDGPIVVTPPFRAASASLLLAPAAGVKLHCTADRWPVLAALLVNIDDRISAGSNIFHID
jgi:uncharacterized membrane protein YhhN